jgi:hypothetical protein
MLAYETSDGVCRSCRFAFAFVVRPAVEIGAASAAPVPKTLDAWLVALPLTAGPALLQQTGTASVSVPIAVCRSAGWRTKATSGEEWTADPGESNSAGSTAMLPVDLEVSTDSTSLEIHVRPRAQDGTSSGAPSSAAARDAVAIHLLWTLQPSTGPRRIGLLGLPVMHMAPLLAHQALRMETTVPSARQGDLHHAALCSDSDAHDSETQVAVVVRVRNVGTHSMSVCLECGDIAPRLLAASASLSVTASVRPAGPLVPPTSDIATLHSCRRHRWLGAVRTHVLDIPPGGEHSCAATLALKGHGVFVVNDYACSWHMANLGARGTAVHGPPIELFIQPPDVQS